MIAVSILRLNLLRAGYLLLVVGLGLTIWPSILDIGHAWALRQGVVVCMLGAMSALAVLGLRHPLRMLPILFFEMAWKTLWLCRVALPLWSANRLDAATAETMYECLGVVIFPFVIPWTYAIDTYFRGAADPWISRRTVTA